ncbi:MAG: DUF3426 domain-containing protein [Gammaproteobacteria bacterium]
MNSQLAPYINCPHCNTIFAAPAQLPAHGKLRCGVCSGVIEAAHHGLQELPTDPPESPETATENLTEQSAEQIDLDRYSFDGSGREFAGDADGQTHPLAEERGHPEVSEQDEEPIDPLADPFEAQPSTDEELPAEVIDLAALAEEEPVAPLEGVAADEPDLGGDEFYSASDNEEELEETLDLASAFETQTSLDGDDEEELEATLDLATAYQAQAGRDSDEEDLEATVNLATAFEDQTDSDELEATAKLASEFSIPVVESEFQSHEEADEESGEAWLDLGEESPEEISEGDLSDREEPDGPELSTPESDPLDPADIELPASATENKLESDLESELPDEAAEQGDVAEELPLDEDEQAAADAIFASAAEDDEESANETETAAETAAEITLDDVDQEEVILIEDESDADADEDSAERIADDDDQAAIENEESEDQIADRLFAQAEDDEDPLEAEPEEQAAVDELPQEPENEQLDFGSEAPSNIDEVADQPADTDTPVATEADQEFSDSELQPVRSSRWWLVAHLGLLLLLVGVIAGQLLYLVREPLKDHPVIRPWQETLCSVIGCELPVRRDASQLGAVAKVVISHPMYLDALRIDLSLQNRADYAQPFPTIRLLFLDRKDRPVAGRDFAPQEYLVGPLADKTELQPMVPEQIVLEIKDPGKRAVNYRFSYF